MRKRTSILFGFIIVLQACYNDTVYSEYMHLDNAEWRQEQNLKFTIPVKDTTALNNVFINIRNTKDYAYSNLFLITQMTFPDKTKVVDTLEYEMTDAQGNFLGSGFSDIKENKLFYKEKVRFTLPGNYLFEVRQAMRERNAVQAVNPLTGVKDVGISIEKIK